MKKALFSGAVVALALFAAQAAKAETRTYWWGTFTCVNSCPAIGPFVQPKFEPEYIKLSVKECTFQNKVNATCVAHYSSYVSQTRDNNFHVEKK